MEENTENKYRLYILMRTDLPSMNPGKAMAQAAHASNLLVHRHGNDQNVQEWLQSANGFGTTIVLGVKMEELLELITDLGNMDEERGYNGRILTGAVIDPTYPYSVNSEIFGLLHPTIHTAAPVWNEDLTRATVFRKETTCGYVFCSEADAENLKFLELHP